MAKARIVDENLEEMEDEVIKEGEIPIKIGRKVYTGRIIDNEGVKIHPAIDVVEGHAYLGYWATVEVLDEYGEVVTIDKVPILIRDDGLKILYAEKYLRQYGMSKMFTPVEWENWWSGKTVDVDPKEFYNEVYSKFTYYIDAPKHSYHLLTLWTIGTIFHPIFDSWPYIFLHGPKRSGKTKTLTLIGQMSYNSAPATSLSEAVLYRAVHNARHTLLMDEQETLANPNRKSEFRRLLLGGYKKGFYVWRSDKVKNDKIVPQKYMIYSPKAIANIEGMEDVLGDRSILVSIIRTSNIKIAKRGLKHLDPSWQPIRDKLASLFFKYHREVAECYDAAMRALGEEKDMSGIPDHLKPIFENIWNKIYARNLELWGPIFAVAIFFEKHGVRGIVESIAEFSMEDITVKKVDDIETPEAGLAYALAKLVTKNGWYSLSAIAEQYRMEMDLSKVDNRTVGRLMKRLGFKNKKKSGGKIQYYLTVDKVRDVAKRLEVPVDDMGGETSTSDIDPEVISRLRNFMGELGGEAHIRFVYAFLKAQGLSDIEVETLLKRLKNEGKIVAMEDGTIKTLLF